MRGRKPRAIPHVKKKISLPEPLVREINELLVNPMSGQPGLGEWSALVERLLREYIIKIKEIQSDIKP